MDWECNYWNVNGLRMQLQKVCEGFQADWQLRRIVGGWKIREQTTCMVAPQKWFRLWMWNWQCLNDTNVRNNRICVCKSSSSQIMAKIMYCAGLSQRCKPTQFSTLNMRLCIRPEVLSTQKNCTIRQLGLPGCRLKWLCIRPAGLLTHDTVHQCFQTQEIIAVRRRRGGGRGLLCTVVKNYWRDFWDRLLSCSFGSNSKNEMILDSTLLCLTFFFHCRFSKKDMPAGVMSQISLCRILKNSLG